jgi:lysophospholipase L1-like esterase
MLKRLLAVLLCFVAASSGAIPASAAPSHYYLALGDSLAFGFSFVRFYETYPAATLSANVFHTGYVDDLALALRAIRPDIQVVNLSCPDESTVSYLQGPCPYVSPTPPFLPFPLHTQYTGTQEVAALTFLKAHPGQVSPITIDLGVNDVLPVLETDCPTLDPLCLGLHLPPVLKTVGTNLNQILAELRAAAPTADIIIVGYYNPFGVTDPASDVITIELNEVIKSAASPYGVRLADAFTPFNRTGNETFTLCALTLMCIGPYTPYGKPDIHPSDLGYAVIANQIWNVLGYTKFLFGGH